MFDIQDPRDTGRAHGAWRAREKAGCRDSTGLGWGRAPGQTLERVDLNQQGLQKKPMFGENPQAAACHVGAKVDVCP
jgi:hypothetical protein